MLKKDKLRYNEYFDMQSIFDELYQQSRNNNNFYKLMEVIGSKQNIRLAYRNLKGNTGSKTKGTDGKTIEDISKLNDDMLIKEVRARLEDYKPLPVRRVYIPKPGSDKKRPLGIPTIWDRLIQQCILQVLEPICEPKFHNHSYGFRPNRSTHHAVSRMVSLINLGRHYYCVDIDIKGFFDNVNHGKLMKQIWNLGIRDKRLLCIISKLLKCEIEGEGIPTKGTPQGGILSPLLSNIVLNELDWWVASQWEFMPTHTEYQIYSKGEKSNRGNVYRVLRKSELKEMFIVRYADDFKIFCRKRNDANKVFIAVKKWLKERLKLDISEEKSKVVNLKKQYSEFLEFKLKAVLKGDKYVVKSHMSDKAIQSATQKLKGRIKDLQRPRDLLDEKRKLNLYNSTVWGIHNYFKYATHISFDCACIIHNTIRVTAYNRLGDRLEKQGSTNNRYILEHYGRNRGLRYLNKFPMCPISFIQTQAPFYKKKEICKYTKEGREKIHQNLKFDITVLLMLMREKSTSRSIEYMDNRLSLWAAQYGRCAVTGKSLWIDEIHCHHKIPLKNGGSDKYQNLVIVHKNVHGLIHATNSDTVQKYLDLVKPTAAMLKKINKLRLKVGNTAI